MLVTNSNTTTRWRVPALAWVPITLAIGAEAASNVLRAYGLGAHLESFTIHVPALGVPVSLAGAVLGVAAIVISLAQARVAWVAFTPSGSRGQRLLAGLTLPLLLAISIAAMASTILEAQRTKVGGESHDRTAYTTAKAAYDAAKADHDRVGSVRSTAEVRAAMERVRIPGWAWTDTKQCTADAGSMSAEAAKACRPILDLRLEMAQAITKTDAGKAMELAATAMARLTPPAEQSVEENIVSRGWAWIMGLGVVLVATFGSVLFARVETVTVEVPAETAHGPVSPPASPQTRALPPPVAQPKGGVESHAAALADLQALLHRREPIPSQDWLAERWGRSKTWVSLRLGEWEGAGEIPSRTSVGRCKTFESA